jgi:hypothetical protein
MECEFEQVVGEEQEQEQEPEEEICVAYFAIDYVLKHPPLWKDNHRKIKNVRSWNYENENHWNQLSWNSFIQSKENSDIINVIIIGLKYIRNQVNDDDLFYKVCNDLHVKHLEDEEEVEVEDEEYI